MIQGIARAIMLLSQQTQLQLALTTNDSLDPRTDSGTDQLQMALNSTDRPEILTWQHTSNLEENPVRVQIGFRYRPLRDGGGKPSPGIRPPHRRPTSKIAHKGANILRLIQPWLPSLAPRLDVTSKAEMFTESQLEELRQILSPQVHHRFEGQPFYLDLRSELATEANDPDHEYPKTLEKGCTVGCHFTNIGKPEHLAHKRRDVRGTHDGRKPT